MIFATSIISNGSTGGSASYTTASVSPTANYLEILAVSNAKTATVTEPTVTGAGVTWTKIATFPNAAATRRITLFRSLNASPGSGALTIDFGGASQSSCQWALSEFSGMVTTGVNGADAIVQNATVERSGTVNGTVSLSAFGNVNNATFGAIEVNGGPAVTPGSGFTELNETTATLTLESEFNSGNDTTVDWSWTGNQNAIAMAVEIKAVLATILPGSRTLTGVGV